MPLTNAEKQRRYREKLKNNPQKKEEIRKNNLERIKKKTKKIQDLTENEKTEKRKQWREQKQKQKKKKIATAKNETKRESEPINNNPKFNIRLKKLKINYKKALNTIVKLNKTIASLRKRNYRQKILHEVQIQKKDKEVDKLTCRIEVTESMVKAMYKCSSSLKKRQLKDVALNETRRHDIHSKGFVAKCLGVARVRKYKKIAQRKSEIIRDEITKFYVRNDITRLTAGKKECRTKHKEKHQIRYLTDTINNLYKIYKSGGGQHSFTTFYKYKPFFVISPTAGSRDTCLCIKHSNINYLMKAMIYNKLIDRYTTLEDILLRINCDITSFDCMHSKCPGCENSTMEFNIDDDKEKEQVKWWWWQSEKHSYTKRDKNSGQDKDILTRKMTKQLKTGTLTELIETFNKELKLFKKHSFNMKTQQNQYRACMEQLKSHEVLIICDYSENYNTKLSEEIQSMHFGASKQQVTLHCVMVYWKDKCQSFCTVSDSPCHEPAAIWAHLLPVIKYITEHSPNTTVLHFYSDGPTSQYRQKKNYFLLNMFVQKMNFNYATWSFTESGHGKGVADGIGGAVKRCLDRQVLYGHDLRNADDVFTNITAAMKSVKSFWIPVQDIENMKQIIPTNLRPLTGNNEMHQIVTTKKENVVLHRPLSCFCGNTPGLCCCYFPKSHSLLENRRFADFTVPDKDTPEVILGEDISLQPSQFAESDGDEILSEEKKTSKELSTLVVDDAVVQEEHNSEMFLGEHISLLGVSPHSEDAVVQEEHNTEMFLGEHISLLGVLPHSEDAVVQEEHNTEMFLGEHISLLGVSPHSEDAVVQEEHNSEMFLRENISLQGASQHSEDENGEIISQAKLVFKEFPALNLKLTHPDCYFDEIKELGEANACSKKLKTNDASLIPIGIKRKNIFGDGVPKKVKVLMPISMPSSSENKYNRVKHDNKPKILENIKIMSASTSKFSSHENKATCSKSLKTVVTRFFICYLCKLRKFFTKIDISVCMVCKNSVCKECSGHQASFDYICDKCFE